MNNIGSTQAVKYLYRSVLCLTLCWSSVALGQPPSFDSFTNSSCTAYGVTGSLIIQAEVMFGPATILIGDRGSCTLQPPAAGCGTGTFADPYDPDCGEPLGIASFTAGTSYAVIAGETNYNTNTVTLTPVAVTPVQTSTPVPLGPWVPLGSGLGLVLLTLLWSRGAGKT